MIAYHGTTMEIQKPDIKHSKAHLDFGEGFYMTTFPKQAERWVYRKGMRLSKPAIVNVYEIGYMSGYRVHGSLSPKLLLLSGHKIFKPTVSFMMKEFYF